MTSMNVPYRKICTRVTAIPLRLPTVFANHNFAYKIKSERAVSDKIVLPALDNQEQLLEKPYLLECTKTNHELLYLGHLTYIFTWKMQSILQKHFATT